MLVQHSMGKGGREGPRKFGHDWPQRNPFHPDADLSSREADEEVVPAAACGTSGGPLYAGQRGDSRGHDRAWVRLAAMHEMM